MAAILVRCYFYQSKGPLSPQFRQFNEQCSVNQIHFHKEGEMNEVYKVLPKSCLPEDFGGELANAVELHENYCKWMHKLHSHFKVEEEYRVDEKKRLSRKGSKKNAMEAEPDLRKLEID